MPSMWKKQKGNRISRLVSDLQTTPKRGNSLVVETGFPTSVADLFVKNHDKLKKSSKKKHRSKQPPPSPSTPAPLTPYGYDHPSPVSNSLSKLDVSSCSVDDRTEELVAQKINSDFYVDETVARKNPRLEFNRDYCNYEDDLEEDEENWRKPNSKKAILMLVLKGVLVVAVGVYTRSFVLGVSIGAFVFCLLEYLGNSVLGLFRPCEDVRRKLRGFSPSLSASKPRRVGDQSNGKKPQEGALNGAFDIGIKRDKRGENGVVSTRPVKPKAEIMLSSKREIDLGVGNDKVARRGVELQDGDNVVSKDRMELGVLSRTLNNGHPYKIDEELRDKAICEIEAFEPSSCESSSCPSPLPYELRGVEGAMENGGGSEDFEMVDPNGKVKKGKKKFWGKFAPKQSKKKKNKHRKGKHHASDSEAPLHCIEEISPESDEGNYPEGEQKMLVRRVTLSSLSLSSLDEQERGGVEHIGVANHSNTEMWRAGDRTTKTISIIKRKNRNLKCLSILGIALAGLTGGRVFALVLTVVCCLIFKIVRG